MSLGKLLFVFYASLACHLAQADDDLEISGPQFWSQVAKTARGIPTADEQNEPGREVIRRSTLTIFFLSPAFQVDHFIRSVREVLEAKARRNTERDHYLRTLRSGPTNARDHYLRSLRSAEEASKPLTRDHYLRSLRSAQDGTPSTRDHYLRSLRSDEAKPATRDHYLRSLRGEEATAGAFEP